MCKKIHSIFLAIAFFPLIFYFHREPCGAEEVSKKEYTLKEIIHIALEKYEPVKVEEGKIREAEELAKHFAEWYNPEFSISGGKKATDSASGAEWSVGLSQKMSFSGKKRLMEEIALIEKSRAILNAAEMKLFVRYEVTRLAYEYAYHLQRKRHVANRLKRFQLINAYMAGRILVPPEKKVERAIVQTRISMLEKEVYKVDSDIASVCARLNLYTGFPSADFPKIVVRWFTKSPELDSDAMLRKSREVSFIVRIQKEILAAALKNKEIEERVAYPDVGISLYYSDARADVHERSFGGGFSFPIPLFSRNKHAIVIADEKIKAEEQKLIMAQKRASEDMKVLLARLEYINAMLTKFSLNDINDIEEKMRYTDSEFRKGRVPMQMYLEMDASSHEMLEEIFRIQLDLVTVQTAIRFLGAEELLLEGNY